jgi:hypothetical protein
MFNATNNHISFLSAALMAASVMLGSTACSGGSSDADAKAEQMVAEAANALDRGDYESATAKLDSMISAYPKAINARRQAIDLRPKIIERQTQQEIAELQMLMQATSQFVDSLQAFFTTVPRSDDQLESYVISNSAPKNWRERNTAIARMSPSGEFYMISSLAGRTTHHTAISLTSDGVTVTSGTVPYDAESLLSRESVRFASGAADTLGVVACQFDAMHRPATLRYLGGKTTPSTTLSADEIHAIADTWRLSQAVSSMAPMASRLEQLKAKLQLARDQQARRSTDDDDASAEQ